MKLSERNQILSQVSEVLVQCQSLIKSLPTFDVLDDCHQQFQSTRSRSSKCEKSEFTNIKLGVIEDTDAAKQRKEALKENFGWSANMQILPARSRSQSCQARPWPPGAAPWQLTR